MKDEGIISIKLIKGRRKNVKRKTRRGPGKIKKKVNIRKQTYVKITRKLRTYIKALKERSDITKDHYWDLRKKVRMRVFKSKANLKDYLKEYERTGGESAKIVVKRSKPKKGGKKKKKK